MGAGNVTKDELGDLGLTAKAEAAIVAFLKTLSDGYVPLFSLDTIPGLRGEKTMKGTRQSQWRRVPFTDVAYTYLNNYLVLIPREMLLGLAPKQHYSCRSHSGSVDQKGQDE